MRKMGTMSALGSLADFDDFSAFDGNTEVSGCCLTNEKFHV